MNRSTELLWGIDGETLPSENKVGAGKTAQRLEGFAALAALAEGLSSDLSTHAVIHHHLDLQFWGPVALFWLLQATEKNTDKHIYTLIIKMK